MWCALTRSILARILLPLACFGLVLLHQASAARVRQPTSPARSSVAVTRKSLTEPAALRSYYAEAAANVSSYRSSLYGRVLRYYSDQLIKIYPDAAWDNHALKFGPIEPRGHERFGAWEPFITCPNGKQPKRYGGDGDGGKLLCSLETMKAPCSILSLGSNYDTTFEQAMLKHTPCNVHTFDCTVDLPSLGNPRHVFHKRCIGNPKTNGEGEYISVEKAAAMTGTEVTLLKCDIELFEHALLSGWGESTAGLPQQLSMELHYNAAVSHSTVEEYKSGKDVILKSRAQLTFGELSLLAAHLTNLGYGIVSREDNPLCPACTEVTLYRVEALVPSAV